MTPNEQLQAEVDKAYLAWSAKQPWRGELPRGVFEEGYRACAAARASQPAAGVTGGEEDAHFLEKLAATETKNDCEFIPGPFRLRISLALNDKQRLLAIAARLRTAPAAPASEATCATCGHPRSSHTSDGRAESKPIYVCRDCRTGDHHPYVEAPTPRDAADGLGYALAKYLLEQDDRTHMICPICDRDNTEHESDCLLVTYRTARGQRGQGEK